MRSNTTIIKGRFNKAKVFTDNIEDGAVEQIKGICEQRMFKDSKIRIMPDCHKGSGCVIGTTMTITDKVVPNLVGVDIGCGMLTVELGSIDLDLKKIDEYIHKNIPHGFNVNEESQLDYKDEINSLRCIVELRGLTDRFNKALGSLGGGNHFIEINEDTIGDKFLVIHSGSRNLGHQVASHYQSLAYEYHNGLSDDYKDKKQEMISDYKAKGIQHEIQNAIKQLKENNTIRSDIPKELLYLEGNLMNDYIHDMKIVQEYANLNRLIMAKRIVSECLNLDITNFNYFQTVHNYIDLDDMMLRKGATSAKDGELVLIPINMRDGSILAYGEGNKDWNYSAPHGAGRIMSRTVAKEKIDLDEFKMSMDGIYSTSVGENTIDEAPMAYKDMQEIIDNTRNTIGIIDILKPIYNFKSH